MSKALKLAIEKNDPEAVQEALKKVKDVNRKIPGADTPLAYACAKGADKVLEALFKAGAVAEKRHMFEGDKPFAIAAAKKQLGVMKRFLELKKVPPETFEQVVDNACIDGRPEVLEFLLQEAKPPVDLGMYRLATATKLATALLKILLKNGGDVKARFDTDDAKGVTILHELVHEGKAAVIRVLVEAGADVNARDEFGRTPLMMLAWSLHTIRFVNRHAERTLKSLESGEAKLLAGEPPVVVDPIEALETLIQSGADGKLVDNFGNDALDYCRYEFWRDKENAPEPFVKILKKAGARSSDATFELLDALRTEKVPLIQAAIKKGADVNRVTPPPCSSTPVAMASDHLESLQTLLQAGADPNRSFRGHTPLIYAARRGQLDIVKALVAAGANIYAVYRSGDFIENAYSASERHEEVRAYLKSLGAKNPKYDKAEALKPGVESWNDFSELLVKGTVEFVAKGLAKMIGGKAHLDVYGQGFSVGAQAYVVIRPRGMNWCNVFRIAPPRLRFEDIKSIKAHAGEVAEACGATVLSVEYSDTSDAASVVRIEPGGETMEDQGWDHDTLQEMVDAMGDEAPEWAKQKLAETDEDDLNSSERVVALAEKEKFVAAAFWFAADKGKKVEIEVTGYGPEAFDGVAFVSN